MKWFSKGSTETWTEAKTEGVARRKMGWNSETDANQISPLFGEAFYNNNNWLKSISLMGNLTALRATLLNDIYFKG